MKHRRYKHPEERVIHTGTIYMNYGVCWQRGELKNCDKVIKKKTQ